MAFDVLAVLGGIVHSSFSHLLIIILVVRLTGVSYKEDEVK